jgi:hypothetical protein
VPYCRDAKRVPENGELPNSPKATVPFSWSPSIEPLNVSVKGMGSVIDIFHDKAGPSTTPSNLGRVSVGHLATMQYFALSPQ